MTSQCDDTQRDSSEGEQCDDPQCDESQGEAPHWDKEARWLEHHWGDESGSAPTTPEGWAEASAEMKTKFKGQAHKGKNKKAMKKKATKKKFEGQADAEEQDDAEQVVPPYAP